MNFVLVGREHSPPKPVAAPVVVAARAIAAATQEKPQASACNRRWTARQVLDRPGSIGASALPAPANCIVRNTSRHGAMLEVSDGKATADRLPECFTLVFTNNRIRSEVNCAIRWRRGRDIGVSFIGSIRTTVDKR